MTKRVKVRVINLDMTEEIKYYPIGAWALTNDFYGDLVQDGIIYTCFVEIEDLVGVST
jgi:hypothetical protein